MLGYASLGADGLRKESAQSHCKAMVMMMKPAAI